MDLKQVCNVLKALMGKVSQYVKKDEQYKQTDGNSEKRTKGNARDQKHCSRNEQCLLWAHW